MASLAYFKRTLPAPTATADGFVCVLNEDWFLQANVDALDGTTFVNGGGNLIVYEDTALTSRLSVDVMSFVAGASPSVEVWIRLPSYNAAKDVYISADDTQTTQPLPSDTYGQYATYQDDVYVTHDGLTDRTGNSTITQSGSPSSGVSPWGGDSVSLNGSSQYGRASVSLPATRPLTYSAWAKPRSVPSQAAFVGGYNSDFSLRFTYDVLGIRESALSLWTRVGGNVIVKSTETIILNDWVRVTGVATSDSERSINADGIVNTSTEVNNPSTHTFNRISYGRHDDNSPSGYFDGELAGMRITTRILSDSFLALERLNQSDPSSFGTSSDWTIPSTGDLVAPIGITGVSSVGEPSLSLSSVLIQPQGVESSALLGQPILTQGGVNISPEGITNVSFMGIADILPGGVNVSPSGIESITGLGTPSLLTVLSPQSIGSGEVVGEPSMLYSQLVSIDNGIGSGVKFGIALILDGESIVIPVNKRGTYQKIAEYLRDTDRFVSYQNNDIIVEWLKMEGITQSQFNDLFYAYWEREGYSGAYNDKWKKWRNDETVILVSGGDSFLDEIAFIDEEDFISED